MKKIRIASALLAVLAIAVGGRIAAQSARTVRVQLLAINDFHGNLEPPSGADGLVNQVPAGGAEYLATHIRNAMKENPDTIFVAAGDLMGASPLISALSHDAPTIEALNAMNLAVTSIGNHELDPGPVELLRRIEGGGNFPSAHYQYLAANVVTQPSGATLLPATAVRTVGGVKIGFIGETLQGTGQIISPDSSKGLQFLDEATIANGAAARLEASGVHAIVLLIHQGGEQRPASGPADPNGCANFSGAITSVVDHLSPSIKVVISGHTHQFYNCVISGHTVTSAGSYGRLFTRLNLSIDAATDSILKVDAKNEIVTRDVAKDPAETAIIAKYKPEAARLADQIVGFVTAPIMRAPNQAGESALGDVIADAQLASAATRDKGGAVVAFMNPGGIRADVTGRAGSEVSYGDLYTAQPFGNRMMVVTMTGDMIRRVLEQQFRANGNPVILQVSQGFTYKVRRNAPLGQHVEPGSIALNGRPLASTDSVRVAVNDYLTTGGDGFTVFSEGKNQTVGELDVDALASYFKTRSPVAPGPRNRIIRTD